MDSTLRPKAAAKRMESRLKSATSSKASIKSASSDKNPSERPAKFAPRTFARHSIHHMSGLDGVDVPVTPAWSQLQNPYLTGVSLRWTEIQEMDRRVYLLQKGAPIDSDTLPQDWNNETFKKVLLDEGITTLDRLDRQNNIQVLKDRYESVRLGLQNFFKSEPEPGNKYCWTLSKTEGFDVYDMQSGSRYWRHQMESVVKGITISINPGSAPATAQYIIADRNREATDGNRERHVHKEAVTLKYMQDVTKEGGRSKRPHLEPPQVLEVDSERAIDFDHEDDGERGAITETEDSLIESMRGEHVSSSMMSDAALEELLLPAEQDLREEPDYEVTADHVLSDLKVSGITGRFLAHPDKAFDKLSCELAQTEQMNKKKMTSGDLVCPQGTSDEPRATKTQIKTKKRKSRAAFAVIVHEDPPDRTPLVKKVIRTNPVSPDTDIPKENLEGDGSVRDSSQVEIIMPQPRRQHRATSTSSTRRVRVATTATPRYRSPSSSPASSSRTVR